MLSEAELVSQENVLEEVSRITGLKQASAAKYAAELSHGREVGRVEQCIGPAGKGAASSPTPYLRMMGTLLRVTRAGPGCAKAS